MVEGSIRKIQYPLNRSLDIESDTPNEVIAFLSLDNWVTSDPDERVRVVINLSLNEYVALASSLDVGRDIAYGDNSIEIWWIWSRILSSLTLCDDVLSCINENGAIQEAISNIAINPVPVKPSSKINQAISDTNVVGDTDIVTCDLDKFFGAMTGMVDLMNNVAEDIIELLSAEANDAGRLGDLIEAIPGIGEFPADDLLQFLESYIDDLEQNYQASYTQALRDEYRCELFCLGSDDCTLSFKDIFQYFIGKLGQSVPTNDLFAFVTWFMNNPLTSVSLVHAWHVFLAGILRFAGSVIGIDSKKFVKMVSALYNDPNPDHTILCDCPQPFNLEALQLTDSLSPAVIVNGVYNTVSFAVDDVVISAGTIGSRVYFDVPIGATLISARMVYDERSDFETRQNRIIDGADGAGIVLSSDTPTQNTNHVGLVLDFNGSHVMANDRVQFSVNANNAGSSFATLREISVTYEL